MTYEVSLTVNGQAVSETVEARTLLVDLLRDTLGLTGTHVGCDTSQCGACVVHVDGTSVKSCTLLAVQADLYPHLSASRGKTMPGSRYLERLHRPAP